MKEKGGYPWTTMPDYMFAHAAAGYGGHGTLCGALGVCSTLINLVAYDDKGTYAAIIDRMMYWYSEQLFPTERFDDIAAVKKQVKVKAKSPLCHISVSQWTLAAGANVSSDEKKQRCAKVVGETLYTVTHYLNEYFDGKWKPVKWSPSPQIAHCIECHGPDDMWHTKGGMNNQQGHMECLLCHGDHTKQPRKK